jgi:hypothetical protein
LLVAVSLSANAALVCVFVARPALLPPAFRNFFTSDADRAARAADESHAIQSGVAARAKADAARRAKIWASLQTDDLPSLIARLRAAGFSPVVIRAVVNAKLEATFSARMNDLLAQLGDASFWKPEPFSSFNNPKFYENYNQLYRDRAKALRELLGDDYFAMSAGDATAAQRRQFGDLPKAKIDLVQRVVDDYNEMMSQVRAASQGIMLPEDREKLALLEREKRADLAAVLSPAELEDYEMRNSTVTSRLRMALTLMDASDAEFRAIYHTQQPFADLLYPTGPMTYTQDLMRQREDAQKKVNDQLKAALGDARYAEYVRSTNYDYQQLVRLAQRESLPQDAIVRAYDLRNSVAAESVRIAEAKLPPDEYNAALQQLAQSTRTKLTAALGPKVADAYATSSQWITAIERGWTIRVTPDGQMSFSSPPPPPKK